MTELGYAAINVTKNNKKAWLSSIGIGFVLTSPFSWIAVLYVLFGREVFDEGYLLGIPVTMVLSLVLTIHIIFLVVAIIVLQNLFSDKSTIV